MAGGNFQAVNTTTETLELDDGTLDLMDCATPVCCLI